MRGPKNRDRLAIDEEGIEALAQDIKENTLINPILVRKNADGYEVVAGERRFLAVQRLGWERVACHVQDLDDKTAALLRAVENLGRKDLSPVEEAYIYHGLVESHGLTVSGVAKRLSRSFPTVKRRLELLKMPDAALRAVHNRSISPGVAEELWRLRDEDRIGYFLELAVDNGATRAVVRMWVNDELKAKSRGAAAGEGGGPLANPLEVTPSYITCDFCFGPVELGKDTVLRACPDCRVKLREAGRG